MITMFSDFLSSKESPEDRPLSYHTRNSRVQNVLRQDLEIYFQNINL